MNEEQLLEFDLEGADGLEPAGEENGIQLAAMEEVEAAVAVLQHPHYYAHRFIPAHSSNYSGGRFGRPIQYLICHIVQGSYGSCINWFQNPQANVSSTYVVSREGHTTQMVSEGNTPWTNGNSEANMRSVTIEHEGWASQGGPSEAQLHASAKLFAGTAIRHNIPLDFQHFFGHTHVRGANRPCPGPWPWQRHLDLIKRYVRGSANPSPPPEPPRGSRRTRYEFCQDDAGTPGILTYQGRDAWRVTRISQGQHRGVRRMDRGAWCRDNTAPAPVVLTWQGRDGWYVERL